MGYLLGNQNFFNLYLNSRINKIKNGDYALGGGAIMS